MKKHLEEASQSTPSKDSKYVVEYEYPKGHSRLFGSYGGERLRDYAVSKSHALAMKDEMSGWGATKFKIKKLKRVM